MASNFPGQCCLEGFRHEYESRETIPAIANTECTRGEPQGSTIKIANDSISAYLATPPAGKGHKDVGILYVADIFGIWNNSKLVADEFAKKGYTCLIPDLFNGDQCPDPRPSDFNIQQWFAGGSTGDNPHTAEQVDPIVVAGIEALKGLGFSKIGAVGYCFGAKVGHSPSTGKEHSC